MNAEVGSNPQCVLRCIACGAQEGEMRRDCMCAQCGDLLEVHYPACPLGPLLPAQAKALWLQRRTTTSGPYSSGVWRFRELLPVVPDAMQVVTLREGNTPLYELPRCGAALGLPGLPPQREGGAPSAAGVQYRGAKLSLSPTPGRASSTGRLWLWAKHQGMNPTGSFKDTGMTVAVSQAQQAGAEWLACASTGNTSASMAAYATRAGLRSLVLVPEGKIAPAKLAQALDHGALTLQLRTDFDGCVRVLAGLVERLPIVLVNSINPYRLEGQKTAAVEMLEQMDWQVPDHVVVPGGNLANASALGKGFLELRAWGLIERVPRISIIQAAGASPLVRTLRENGGRELIPVTAESLASAIRIGRPASWKKAVRVLRETRGECVDVSEEEIAWAKAMLGSEGIGCEPASAAALAGAAKLARQGVIAPDELIVLVLTGHELKDTGYSLAWHSGQLPLATVAPKRTPQVLDASLDAVLRALEKV